MPHIRSRVKLKPSRQRSSSRIAETQRGFLYLIEARATRDARRPGLLAHATRNHATHLLGESTETAPDAAVSTIEGSPIDVSSGSRSLHKGDIFLCQSIQLVHKLIDLPVGGLDLPLDDGLAVAGPSRL